MGFAHTETATLATFHLVKKKKEGISQFETASGAEEPTLLPRRVLAVVRFRLPMSGVGGSVLFCDPWARYLVYHQPNNHITR